MPYRVCSIATDGCRSILVDDPIIDCLGHTAILIIHPSVVSVPLMQMTQTSIPKAPNKEAARKNSCTHLVYLTLLLVRGLIGFASMFPYGLLHCQLILISGWKLTPYTMK